MSEWGWICTDKSCIFGCLTEQSKIDHEERTNHDMKELNL